MYKDKEVFMPSIPLKKPPAALREMGAIVIRSAKAPIIAYPFVHLYPVHLNQSHSGLLTPDNNRAVKYAALAFLDNHYAE